MPLRSSTLLAMAITAALAATGAERVTRLDGSRIAASEIDNTVSRLMQAGDVTGVALALFNDRRPAYVKAYGFRDTEARAPLTIDSVMAAASFTKVAFAYTVLQLADEGVIRLDAPIQQYLPRPLPEYAGYERLVDDERYKRLSPRMLLDHTSGFANLRVLEPDRKTHIHFDPGSRYAYSGQGLQLLQLAVEAATQRPLEDLMRENVFQPFGMARTSLVWEERFDTDYANGYDERGRALGAQRRRSAGAAGSMQTTIGDFARFMEAVMAGRRLRAPTRRLMLTPQIRIVSKHQFPTLAPETTAENDAIRLSYGLGWGLYSTPYGRAFFKEGHDEGWRHYTVMFDKPGIGLVIMTNSSNGESIFEALLETLLRNTFTPIEWEGFTPYDRRPGMKK